MSVADSRAVAILFLTINLAVLLLLAGVMMAARGGDCTTGIYRRVARLTACGGWHTNTRHPKREDVALEEFKSTLRQRFEALELAPGTKVRVWVMDEARFGLHTEVRRVWTRRGVRPVVERQTKYEWDYLYGSLDVIEGEAHFLHLPTVNLECDAQYLEHLAASDPKAVHVVIRDQAGFHLRDGDQRLPQRVRIVPLPPYCPELNPCEQLWDVIKDEVSNRVYASIEKLRDAMLPALKRYWDEAGRVLSLVGRPWLRDHANTSPAP